MLARLRLDDKSEYEKAVAVALLVEMLVGLLNGVTHARALGRETGGIQTWDDVVREDGALRTHYQIKRQQTAFGTQGSPASRAMCRDPSRSYDCTELDRTLESLGNYVRNHPDCRLRRFRLVVPEQGLEVKPGLELRQVAEIARHCSKEGVTGSGMAARIDGPTTKVFDWLTTWCGFANWDEIWRAFRLFDVVQRPLEDQLNQETEGALAPWFTDPKAARAMVHSFLCSESLDAGEITADAVLDHVRGQLKPGATRWAAYCDNGSLQGWSVGGSLLTLGRQRAEGAASVVDALWSVNGAQDRLVLRGPWPQGRHKLHLALGRLALHLPSPKQTVVSDGAWLQGLRSEVGGTLGTDALLLPGGIVDPALYADSKGVLLPGMSEQRGEADRLTGAMDAATIQAVCAGVEQRLGDGSMSEEVALALEASWEIWKRQAMSCAELGGKMAEVLSARAEGQAVLGQLRVGRETVGLLVDAVVCLLALSMVAESGDELSRPLGERTIRVIGLSRWSGPATGTRQPRSIHDDLEVLIGQEEGDVVVLSQVVWPETMIYQLALAEDRASDLSLASPRRPRLLTRSRNLQNLLRGSLEALRAGLRSLLELGTEGKHAG